MRVLYIDTSSSYLYAGIVENKKLLCSVKEKLGQELSCLALPRIADMFSKTSLVPNDINKIIVAGVRCYDYKVRLLLANVDENKIVAIEDEKKCAQYLSNDIELIAIVHDIYQYRNCQYLIDEIRKKY